jgi:hypothetical protein
VDDAAKLLHNPGLDHFVSRRALSRVLGRPAVRDAWKCRCGAALPARLSAEACSRSCAAHTRVRRRIKQAAPSGATASGGPRWCLPIK